jgi:hypothetical protein
MFMRAENTSVDEVAAVMVALSVAVVVEVAEAAVHTTRRLLQMKIDKFPLPQPLVLILSNMTRPQTQRFLLIPRLPQAAVTRVADVLDLAVTTDP